MKRAVVDASVAVKWYLPEDGALAAVRLLDQLEELLVPDLFFAEVGNALWKKVRRGGLSVAEATAVLELLDMIPMQVYESRSLIREALSLAGEFGSTVYDSLYIALASIERTVLVTADERLFRLRKGRLARLIVPLSEAARG